MPNFVENMLELFQTDNYVKTGVILVFAVLAIIMIGVFGGMLGNTLTTPTSPTGWSNHDYDADQNMRGSLTDLINTGTSGITPDTLMVNVSVATANYSGIFTESGTQLNPWIGHVNPEAMRLQIEAGARAVILDVWPDPANPAIPVICSMKDTNEWSSISWWRDTGGLNKGIGQYSNWQQLTRNKVPATDMIQMACSTAFDAMAPNVQTNDPFFLILRLHGAMTVDYLNYLGATIKTALGSHRMESQWDAMKNQDMLCSAKVSEFMGRGFVIVSPDIQPGYNSLPNTNTWDSFVSQYKQTAMAEVTNVLESKPNSIFYGLGNLDAIAIPASQMCNGVQVSATPAQTGFCIIQPTIGGKTSDNDDQISLTNFQKARQVGAQMVAVNYFSTGKSDTVLGAMFDPALFGKYSFKKGA